MPERLRDEPGRIPPHLTIGGLEWVRIGLLLLVCVLVGFMWAATARLTGIADDIVQNQQQGRAFYCDTTFREHLPLGASCSDPAVVRYRETG